MGAYHDFIRSDHAIAEKSVQARAEVAPAGNGPCFGWLTAMGMFGRKPAFADASHPDRRGGRRVAVGMTGLLSGGGWDEEVTVVNLSEGGAMIETCLALCVDERFVLSIDGWGSVAVVVRWVDGDRAGLAFER